MKKCEFCEWDISDKAKKCKHCWEWVNKQTSSEDQKDLKTTEKKNTFKKEGIHDPKKLTIWWIPFFIILFLGLFLTPPINEEALSQYIGIVIVSYGFWYLLARLFTVSVKDRSSKQWRTLKWIGFSIWAFLVLIGNFSADYEKEKEIKDVISWIEINNDGILDIWKTLNTDTDTTLWNQMKEFVRFVWEKTQKLQNDIDSYENIMYSDNVFSSYNKMKLSVQYHQELIDYLKKYKTEWILEVREEFKNILWYDLNESESYLKNFNKDMELIDSRISMYEKSKLLYKFYLDNFYKLTISTTWWLEIDDSVYNEYETLYNNYSEAYNNFESERQLFIKESQNRLQQFK